MKLTIRRGAHEIGGSCVEVACQSSRIIIDIGIPLCDTRGQKFDMDVHNGKTGQQLICEGILPNIRGLYRWETDERLVDGVLLSHAHLDHYGLLYFVHERVPAYYGEATKSLINLTSMFTATKNVVSQSKLIKNGEVFSCGEFRITPFLMDHSAFDSYAFLIEAEGQRIIYSGDFRNHGRKPNAFQNFIKHAPKHVNALLLEGTMFGRNQGTVQTEQDIEETVVKTIQENNGIVLMCLSAQNIDRLVSLYRASLRTGKLFVIDIYTACVLDVIKDYAKIPYPSRRFKNIRVFYPYWLCRRITREGYEDRLFRYKESKITKEEIQNGQNDIMMMVRSSMLSDLERIGLAEGGTFIYSLWEGYLQDPSMKKLQDFATCKGMQTRLIHTSGHASIDTLKTVVEHLEPKTIVPIHTFHPEDYIILNSNVTILPDGVEMELS